MIVRLLSSFVQILVTLLSRLAKAIAASISCLGANLLAYNFLAFCGTMPQLNAISLICLELNGLCLHFFLNFDLARLDYYTFEGRSNIVNWGFICIGTVTD